MALKFGQHNPLKMLLFDVALRVAAAATVVLSLLSSLLSNLNQFVLSASLAPKPPLAAFSSRCLCLLPRLLLPCVESASVLPRPLDPALFGVHKVVHADYGN